MFFRICCSFAISCPRKVFPPQSPAVLLQSCSLFQFLKVGKPMCLCSSSSKRDKQLIFSFSCLLLLSHLHLHILQAPLPCQTQLPPFDQLPLTPHWLSVWLTSLANILAKPFYFQFAIAEPAKN